VSVASVATLAVFDDGSGPALYAGGEFASSGGVSTNNVARWKSSSWTAVGRVGMDGPVEALTVFDDGRGPALYAGGAFTFPSGGVAANRIARWDGSSWEALGSGVNGDVLALTVFDEGGGSALYVGGEFTTAWGVPMANRIARWDGTSWSQLGSGMNAPVRALAVFDDGSGPALYAGGDFTVAGGVAASRIAKWDGASWSALGSGVSDAVLSLEVFNDRTGRALHAGGSFTTAFDSGDSFLARWGRPDTTPPALSCPTSIVVHEQDALPGEIVTFPVTATDPEDSTPSVVCVPPSGSRFPRGTTLVTCTATDFSGNQASCLFPVTVESVFFEVSPSKLGR